ncbi:MAG: sulfotransferase [Rhodomicrobium sp.]|nr:sulfotransferase [Rhodomicrobium sp.]
MNRPLNFLVLGVARSGTSALTQALNVNPRVICGMETFNAFEDHTNLSYPRSFQDRLNASEGYQKTFLRTVLGRAGATGPIAIGNKEPNYDLSLTRIVKALPDIRLLFIYRHPCAFFESWNIRARDRNDTQWPAGKRGLLGALSLMIYLRELSRLDTECLIIPYSYFSAEVAGSLSHVFRFLGVDTIGDDGCVPLQSIQMQADRLSGKSRAVTQGETDFLNAIAFAELDKILSQDRCFNFSEIRSDIKAYLLQNTERFVRMFIKAICDYDDAEVISYFHNSLRHPAVAALFHDAAKQSADVGRWLDALPRRRKIYRLLFGSNDLGPYAKFIARIQADDKLALNG